MAATTGQGRSLATFVVGCTAGCAGIAYISTGLGKFMAVVGALILAMTFMSFLKMKPLEGRPAQKPGGAGIKLLGAFIATLGWLLVLGGLHMVTGTGGRIVLALVGIGVSLFGIVFILPAAFNKNAIWKS